MAGRGSVFLLYHFFHPDDVISARLYSDLAENLTESGFDVTAVPSIRSCHGRNVRLAKRESWVGGKIRRIWRPAWPQHKTAGRFGNTLFMLLGWTWIAATMPRKRGEVMVVGTDPVLGVLIAITWRLLRPRSRIVHWCHDLYPNAAVADGMISENALWIRMLRWILRIAYRRCDVVADLGICMRKRLQEAAGEETPVDSIAESDVASSPRLLVDGREVRSDSGDSVAPNWWSGRYATLVPWSLIEPDRVVEPSEQIRHELFGNHQLGLLYSGNFGRAHCFESMIALARRLKGDDVGFCFAGRGMRLESVRAETTDADSNIRFAGFADESELAGRLAAADIHLVTLRPRWTGTVVPSKFFGALAAGRPVLFAGDPDSAIAHWIDQFKIGWVLTENTIDELAESIPQMASSMDVMMEMRQRCFDVYHREFSRRVQVERWQRVLTGERYQPAQGQRWLLSKRRGKKTRKHVAASV
jgi:glycosyltransferase involved in cell wall biosynthesis